SGGVPPAAAAGRDHPRPGVDVGGGARRRRRPRRPRGVERVRRAGGVSRDRPAEPHEANAPDVVGQAGVNEVDEAAVRTYYGKAILKEPAWTDEVPWYLFVGGWSGASAVLAAVADVVGDV